MLRCTLLSGTPSSLITAKDWAAKASFNSNTSTSSNVQPAFSTCVSIQQQIHELLYSACACLCACVCACVRVNSIPVLLPLS